MNLDRVNPGKNIPHKVNVINKYRGNPASRAKRSL